MKAEIKRTVVLELSDNDLMLLFYASECALNFINSQSAAVKDLDVEKFVNKLKLISTTR